MRKLLDFSGIDPERLLLKWVSSAEGPRFARVMTEFTEKIRELGPSPLKRSKNGKAAVQDAVNPQGAGTKE